MIPIYEQGQGRGIAHGLDSFLDRFDAICQEHVTSKRAKAFAFIFYDFVDQDLRRILKNQGAFAQLDRLAGDDLSVFYLHMGRRDTVSKFNTAFLSKLGVIDKATPPAWSSSSSRRTRSKRLPSLNWTTQISYMDFMSSTARSITISRPM